MGLMLESLSEALCQRGGPHFGSPDKSPALRLESIEAAGKESVPFTTGILVGIGETRQDRIASLLAIRDLHDRYGHIQELIIQNFKAKPNTPMAGYPEPSLAEQAWSIAAARLVFGPSMSIQAPPNLRPGKLAQLLHAGANDLGGVSPVTVDHVNPEMPWPHLKMLSLEVERTGRILRERFAICPPFAAQPETWLDVGLVQRIRNDADASGLPRRESWFAGGPGSTPANPADQVIRRGPGQPSLPVRRVLEHLQKGREPDESDVTVLFSAFGPDEDAVIQAADRLREELIGNAVTYVVNRNINYTNICQFHCGFCAFAKGSPRGSRDPAYLINLDEVAARAEAAWRRGATEVCLQGGIHPSFTGKTYLEILGAVKSAVPEIHVHAFSPLEVLHGAQSLGWSLERYLRVLAKSGLATIPGTAAEILDDEVRRVICPDKLTTAEWLDVVETAHTVGLPSTCTIMFGHVERPQNWASHLLRLRALQQRTGGFTEFVPLPYVHMEAPLWRRGQSRRGPTYREARLMHAVSRLVFGKLLPNIQVSWVKLGSERAADCLQAGANDLGGILMDESITRAAGGKHGQEFNETGMISLARSVGRVPRQRDTLYRDLEPVLGKLARKST
jgi:FO synthase